VLGGQNLYFAGQLTSPGPGVPPSIISGQVVADLIAKEQTEAYNFGAGGGAGGYWLMVLALLCSVLAALARAYKLL
jgi:hypothetical protein